MRGKTKPLILAIAPNSRGFGFTLFLSSKRLIDWGIKEARQHKNVRCLAFVSELLERYRPTILILEDWQHEACRRSERVRTLLLDLAEAATAEGLTIYCYSRRQVKAVFATSGTTKDAIAAAISDLVPELLPWLPRKRRIWESEQHSMAIFEAAALVLTHTHLSSTDETGADVYQVTSA